ncbi:hypothetical protein PFISCL1PPCAC_3695, partial [Pristionchus fissidentatus]
TKLVAVSVETYKQEIIEVLQRAGEPVKIEDETTFVRLGEGRGMTSSLWTVDIGGRKYAAKISNAEGKSNEECYAQQHNNELQVYEWLEKLRTDALTSPYDDDLKTVRFYGGTKCEITKPGLILMADLSSESVHSSTDVSLSTIFSIIDGVAAYQSAYLSTEEELELFPRDMFFELGSTWLKEYIGMTEKQGWFKEKWRDALNAWSDVHSLSAGTYEQEEGDLPLTLAHSDMWMNNILFSKKENYEELELLAFVDWQAATVGNALTDVVVVVGLNMDASERRKHEREILQHYVDEMKKRCHRFKKEFPIDAMEKLLPQYRRSLRFAALMLLIFIQSEAGGESGTYTKRFIGLLEDIVG